MTRTPRSERRLDLDAHKIMRVVETTPVVLIDGGNPILSDDGDERVAFADPLGQNFDEIEAGRDIVDVEEDVLSFQPFRQAIVNPPGEAAGILAPIADEDAAQHVHVLAPKGN